MLFSTRLPSHRPEMNRDIDTGRRRPYACGGLLKKREDSHAAA